MNTGSPPRPRDVPNTLGLHALIWADHWDTEAAERSIRLTADAGYGLVELPVLEPDALDLGRVRRSLGRAGLGVRCSLGLPFDADISSADAAVVARGEDLLNRALEASAELGSPLLTGVLYSALGKYAQPPAASRGGAAGVLRRLADRAAPLGVDLGLEVVNRYESNLLNTCADALRLIDEIGRANVKVHLDSYHMNIEEPDFATPVAQCGPLLGYVHVGESHRGYLGSGHVDLAALFRALVDAGYTGAITFEGFSSPAPAGLGTTLAVWRRLWDDPGDVAVRAREYMESLLAAAAGARAAAAPPRPGHGTAAPRPGHGTAAVR